MKIIQGNFKYKTPLIPHDPKKIQYIVLHHLDALFATPEEIHQWHLDFGWSGFGYNEYIRKDSTVYIGRGFNMGSQCAKKNSISFGIGCEGDYTKEIFNNPEMFDTIISRIRNAIKYYKDHGNTNDIKVVGHRDLVNTTCPGPNFPLKKIQDVIYNNVQPNNEEVNIKKNIELLKSFAIINNTELWKDSIINNQKVNSDYVNIVLERFITHVIKNDEKILIAVAKAIGIIKDENFWQKSLSQKEMDGGVIKFLFENIANYLYK